MSLTMICKKRGMTRLFSKKTGKALPCTVIEFQPNVISQVKSEEKDGYHAVQLGAFVLSEADKKRQKKPLSGHFKKHKIAPRKVLKESRLPASSEWKEGDEIKADYFAAGDLVDVTGNSKGKGYQGVVKRHNYGTFGGSHGVGPVARHAGSTGSLTAHGEVRKGKKMAGHMGAERVTTEHLEVLEVDVDLGVLIVKGAVPGANGDVVYIRKALKKSLQRSSGS